MLFDLKFSSVCEINNLPLYMKSVLSVVGCEKQVVSTFLQTLIS